MTKRAFSKMLMIIIGFMGFVLGMIVSCDQEGLLHWVGIGILAVGIIALIIGIFTPVTGINKEKTLRVLAVFLSSAILHGLGIVLTIYVYWLLGIPFILAGIIALFFLIPAIKGFKKPDNT